MAEFIQLTDLEGQAIWIGTAWIQAVEEPIPRMYHAGAGAFVLLSGETRPVKETVDQVMEKLEWQHKETTPP
jgi:uncharacterized protein YlzI (FlbEa/FlbD family)